MTKKRFYVDKSPITHLYVVFDNKKEFVFEGVENGSTIIKLVGLLNNALEENEQLKLENGEMEDYLARIEELMKENKELHEQNITECKILKDENNGLKQQLNYIQNSISNAIKHQKTELGQKALKEIIADYNEWIIGHKGDYE